MASAADVKFEEMQWPAMPERAKALYEEIVKTWPGHFRDQEAIDASFKAAKLCIQLQALIPEAIRKSDDIAEVLASCLLRGEHSSDRSSLHNNVQCFLSRLRSWFVDVGREHPGDLVLRCSNCLKKRSLPSSSWRKCAHAVCLHPLCPNCERVRSCPGHMPAAAPARSAIAAEEMKCPKFPPSH